MSASRADTPLLAVEDLSVAFRSGGRAVQALDRVSFAVAPGETVAIVGESGSGKTVTALAALRLLPATGAQIQSGAIRFHGEDVLAMDDAKLRAYRGARAAMIFQEPMTALNPVLTIGEQVAEPLVLHRGLGWRAARMEARELLRRVRLSDPDALLAAYPHQLSGGMRQRVMIAQAIACRPALLIADEPTTALDVTVQAEILALLRTLQRELGMAVLLITHDLAVVAEFAARTIVLYAGRVAETGPTARLLERPRHPYTQGLLASTLELGRAHRGRIAEIPGTVKAVAQPEPVCHFAERCPRASDACRAERPALRSLAAEHHVACLRAEA
ncbi:MAG: ABC transporter ATP-binding protein [Alphaproteobacteria bacterium]|nr:ABC transporter ATP-binding protein [Alphaproteobacteria bacterium]